MLELSQKKCLPCKGSVSKLDLANIKELLKKVPDWHLNDEGTIISQSFKFKNFYETISFVNAVAWMANQEGHHPDLLVSYNFCKVMYQTHSMQGLTENDFICAAKIDQLFHVPDSS